MMTEFTFLCERSLQTFNSLVDCQFHSYTEGTSSSHLPCVYFPQFLSLIGSALDLSFPGCPVFNGLLCICQQSLSSSSRTQINQQHRHCSTISMVKEIRGRKRGIQPPLVNSTVCTTYTPDKHLHIYMLLLFLCNENRTLLLEYTGLHRKCTSNDGNSRDFILYGCYFCWMSK